MNKRRANQKIAAVLMAAGSVFILAAVSLFAYNRWDETRAVNISAQMEQTFMSAVKISPQEVTQQNNARIFYTETAPITAGQNDASTEIDANETNAAEPAATTEPTIEIGDYCYLGVINIPSLDLSLPVLDSWSYSLLKISPCRYSGSVADNNMVIAAHNYKRHFGNISSLEIGDLVIFIDAKGVRHQFAVAEVTTLQPTDIESMTDSGYPLTLFTCTYSGSARVTVRCVYV